MAKVGFIGTGEIARAMVHALSDRGHSIFLSNRNADIANELKRNYGCAVADNQTVLENSDIVFLCLMANVAKDVLPNLTFREDHRVVSVMADISFSELSSLLCPAHQIEMTIPLPSISAGGCPLPTYPSHSAISDLFAHANPIIPVNSENALKAHMAVTALASVSFAQTQAAIDWLASVTQDQARSETYILSMMAGFYKSLPKDGQARVAEALEALNTEGGFNQTLRMHMQNAGAPKELMDGLDAFRPRLGL